MGQFTYTFISSNGKTTTGSISSESRESALSTLRQQNIKPIHIKEVRAKRFDLAIFKGKVKSRDLVIFTRELSTMVSAGVPLSRALETLTNQSENKYFKEVIRNINRDVESGMQLADAFAKHPNVFSDVFINMVRAGEAGGILDEILKRLATQVEKDATIRKKIKSAMAYPVVILSVTVIAFFGIMIFILPKIGAIIKDLGGAEAELPIYSQVMLDISAFLQENFIFMLIIIVAAMWGFKRYIRTEKGKYRWHYFLLKMPVFGKIIGKIVIARFSRTFASLMGAGVSVLESLDVTGKAVGNKVIQKELQEIAVEVKNGQPLGKQLMQAQFFPPIVGQMMSVGEETGKIDQILLKVADFYEEEVETVIDGLASIIEPIMIIVLGGMVGLIAASVMGPIASLSKNIGG